MFQGYSKKDVVTLGFYEGLSENVGVVAGGKGQISDNKDGCRLLVAGF